MKIDAHDLLIILGAELVTLGLAMCFPPVALIFAGALIGGMTYLDGRGAT